MLFKSIKNKMQKIMKAVRMHTKQTAKLNHATAIYQIIKIKD